MTRSEPVHGVLLLYHLPFGKSASTIMEHVDSFAANSRFAVWPVNTELGFPRGLRRFRFTTIVLHYSIFATAGYHLPEDFLAYLQQHPSIRKVAFFQDEHHYCQQRFAFLNRYNIDCVFTLISPQYFDRVYYKYTSVRKLVYTLTGYVSDELMALGQRETKPDHERTIDVGYRARRLSFYMGKGAQEKYDIAGEFIRRTAGLGLRLDIDAEERSRLYGQDWTAFLANCRAVLGVEAGVSIFDLDDTVREGHDRLLAANPAMTFAEMSAQLLEKYEENIPYRTISPRHFEAATLRVCQILFEGEYSGILQPMIHYIPLKKDYSNLDEVLRLFGDDQVRREITDNAYRDLIASGRYTYRQFVAEFDEALLAEGLQPDCSPELRAKVDRLLLRGLAFREVRARFLSLRYRMFPGRRLLVFFAKPVVRRYVAWRQGRFAQVIS